MKRFTTFTLCCALLISSSTLSCDKKSNEKGSDVNSKITALVDDHFDALERGDYEKYSSLYPDFYIDMYEQFAVGYGYANGEAYFIDTEYGYYVMALGDNFSIKATVKSTEKMSEEELQTGETAIKQTYNADVKLDCGYVIEITEEASGSSNSETEEYEMMVLEIDNELYVYNQYFEYMATMQ